MRRNQRKTRVDPEKVMARVKEFVEKLKTRVKQRKNRLGEYKEGDIRVINGMRKQYIRKRKGQQFVGRVRHFPTRDMFRSRSPPHDLEL